MRAVLDIILILLQLYWWVVLIMIIMCWLISFNIINTRNQFVAAVWRVLNQLTEPISIPSGASCQLLGARSQPAGAVPADLLRRTRHHLLHLSQRVLTPA